MRDVRVRRFLFCLAAAGMQSCAGSPPPPTQPQPTAAPAAGSDTAAIGAPATSPAENQPEAPASPNSPRVVLDSDTLRLEGTPPIPDALRVRMGQYLNTRPASLTDVSDDGQRVLITTRFAETRQVHLVTGPMGARTQLTFGDEPASYGRFVPGDRDAVLYSADVGGNEQYQIFRLDLRTGRSTRLTDSEARNKAPKWSRDGRFIAYSSNSRNKRDFDVWLANGRDPASARMLVEGKGDWYPIDWSADASKLLVGEYISINESRLYAVDVATKKITRISPEGRASYRTACFGRNGQTVYVASDRDGEFSVLYETDITGSAFRPLTGQLHWDVESVALSPDGRKLAFTINRGGISALHVLDTQKRRIRPIKGVPKGTISGLRYAAKVDIVAFTLRNSTRPGDVYTYHVGSGKLTRFTAGEMGGLDSDSLIEPTLIEFESFDGRKIPAFYFRPKGEGPFPVVVRIHGGPEGQARPKFYPFVQYLLAESRIAVLIPNVRGSAGYGKTYLTLDNGKKREDSVKDIGALLDWIAARPELDAARVGVIGGSYGGYMVLSSLIHFGDRIAAGVDIVGISNFVTFLQNTRAYRRDLRRAEYGDERDPEMREFLHRISPTTQVARLNTPLFVAQGLNDPRVPASESEQIVKAVRDAGHDVWYLLAKNEGHGFLRKTNHDIFTLLSVMFMEKHLVGANW
ncbi:MAG: alpha/beta fold hydrolase [Proteobacteria bacterium]|nr:alpha/beta fold hydrolase [Pseudomonadota bacterium]